MLNPEVFRAYDIRGIIPDEIDEEGAYKIGCSYGSFLKNQTSKKNPKIVVQSDARPSSPSLKAELIQGLLEKGLEVIDGGLATTPMHYFTVNRTRADGGIMVTASHMPLPYNGFKVSLEGAVNIGTGAGMEELRDLAANINMKTTSSRPIRVDQKNFENDYLEFLLKKIDPLKIKPFRIVVDAGNGMAGLLLEKLTKRLPIEAIPLYWEIDMTFPITKLILLKRKPLRLYRIRLKRAARISEWLSTVTPTALALLTNLGR